MCLVVFILAIGATTSFTREVHPLSDEFIDAPNLQKPTWKAGRNFALIVDVKYIKMLIGALSDPEKLSLQNAVFSLPDSFDSRDRWSNCPTIREIADQGSCSSCWAFGAVEAMIHSDGKKTSDSQPTIWYPSVGHVEWDVMEVIHNLPGDTGSNRHFGKTSYFVSSDPKKIMREIMTNGPVEAALTVYEYLLTYKSGVYKHVQGSVLGGHAIRMSGWGTENDTPYWLIANSWNSDWGDNGYYKIVNGDDHCGIESSIAAGIPKPYV